jgi:hypothetical protein
MYTHPDEWPITPKAWSIVRLGGKDMVAAMMPYPGPDDRMACAGGGREWVESIDLRMQRPQPRVEALRAICNTCPVQLACGEWGIAHEEDLMHGGLTPGERKKIRRKRGQALVEPASEIHIMMGQQSRRAFEAVGE